MVLSWFSSYIFQCIFNWNFEHSFTTLSCEAMQKISSKNIVKCMRKSKKGPILVLSWLVLSCLIIVTVRSDQSDMYSKTWTEKSKLVRRAQIKDECKGVASEMKNRVDIYFCTLKSRWECRRPGDGLVLTIRTHLESVQGGGVVWKSVILADFLSRWPLS